MKINKNLAAVYMGGLLQGITLVAFPAASTLFTSAKAFDFTSSQYGSLFISQCILSIGASLFSSKLSRSFGAKTTFIVGLLANFSSMALFALSALVMNFKTIAYLVLILATSCLGLGFGLTVPTLNSMAAFLRPKNVDTVILVLNALLGLGTTLAPLFTSLFVNFGIWWGLPILMSFLLIVLLVFALPLSLPEESDQVKQKRTFSSPSNSFVLFLLFALLYGIVETLNGNWSVIYMKKIQKASIEMQSLALTSFWALVTFGRVFFACLERVFRPRFVFQWLPVILIFSFFFLATLENAHFLSLLAFALSGLGCSALLPLLLSFASRAFKDMASTASGFVIAFYLLGYGIAAFGTGVILDLLPLNLSSIYGLGAFIAAVLAALAFRITRQSALWPP